MGDQNAITLLRPISRHVSVRAMTDQALSRVASSAFAREITVGAETILLVDEDPVVRSLIRMTLRRYGYTIVEAGSGAEALRTLRSHHEPIQLLVTDLCISDMN